MPTISVLDSSGTERTVNAPNNNGQATMAASSPVVIASDQTALPITATSLPLASGAATSALQTAQSTTLTSIDGKLPASLGQKTLATSLSVAIASDQSSLPVTAASLPLPAGAATSALQTTQNTTLTAISGQLPATLGQKTKAASLPVTLASDQVIPVQVTSTEYEAVAASSTATLGTTGATGDLLVGLLVVPASTSPGSITISDGGNPAITVFAGGTNSVTNLVSFFIPLGIKSNVGPWSVTTGSGLSVLAVGDFT